MKLFRRLVTLAPKERRKGQEDSPSSLPLLGKRMIPHGGRERNFDESPNEHFVLNVQTHYDKTYRLAPAKCTSAGVWYARLWCGRSWL